MDLLVPQPRPKESNREYACRVLRMNIMTFRLKRSSAGQGGLFHPSAAGKCIIKGCGW